jgi:sensor domain CHASE-containing protein
MKKIWRDFLAFWPVICIVVALFFTGYKYIDSHADKNDENALAIEILKTRLDNSDKRIDSLEKNNAAKDAADNVRWDEVFKRFDKFDEKFDKFDDKLDQIHVISGRKHV